MADNRERGEKGPGNEAIVSCDCHQHRHTTHLLFHTQQWAHMHAHTVSDYKFFSFFLKKKEKTNDLKNLWIFIEMRERWLLGLLITHTIDSFICLLFCFFIATVITNMLLLSFCCCCYFCAVLLLLFFWLTCIGYAFIVWTLNVIIKYSVWFCNERNVYELSECAYMISLYWFSVQYMWHLGRFTINTITHLHFICANYARTYPQIHT